MNEAFTSWSPIIDPHTHPRGLHVDDDPGRGFVDELSSRIIDTSGMQPEAGIVEYAVEHLGAERVVFGSDAFYRDFPPQIGQVVGADLADEQLRLILHDNAERILGLDDRG